MPHAIPYLCQWPRSMDQLVLLDQLVGIWTINELWSMGKDNLCFWVTCIQQILCLCDMRIIAIHLAVGGLVRFPSLCSVKLVTRTLCTE